VIRVRTLTHFICVYEFQCYLCVWVIIKPISNPSSAPSSISMKKLVLSYLIFNILYNDVIGVLAGVNCLYEDDKSIVLKSIRAQYVSNNGNYKVQDANVQKHQMKGRITKTSRRIILTTIQLKIRTWFSLLPPLNENHNFI